MILQSPLLARVALLAALAAVPVSHAGNYFDITELKGSGRQVAAEFADVDGDGRRDLLIVSLSGIPPKEHREVSVYLQRKDHSFANKPNHRRVLPRWSALYDIADVRQDSPGEELILLRPHGVTILSLSSSHAPSWDLKVPGPSTMGVADDERGLEPYKMVYHDFGDQPWILVPQLGQLTALSATGTVLAQLDVPRRANYFVPPASGLVSLESAFQLYVDVPKLLVGDIDGDGQSDIASATRHELKVFLRRQDGSFAQAPDRDIALKRVTPRDHIRGSGGVTCDAGDIDGDGTLDLMISHVAGGFTDATTTLSVFLNKGGRWRLDAPDQTIVERSTLSSNTLFDLLGDGKLELMRIEFRFGVLEIVETLLSRSVDVTASFFRYTSDGGKRGNGGFEKKPEQKKKLHLPINFETFRPSGFMPSAKHDLNGDGHLDFITSGNGKKIDIYPGGPEGPFDSRALHQNMATAGVIHFADWTGDGLVDFVLFDPHNFDAPVRLGRNLGTLPGTRKTSSSE